jgi:hypothetical protein
LRLRVIFTNLKIIYIFLKCLNYFSTGLKLEIEEQRSKLRSVDNSVASKYQKPKIVMGGEGILSAMQDSSLLLKSGMGRRRQEIMPSEETISTQHWGSDESWQS